MASALTSGRLVGPSWRRKPYKPDPREATLEAIHKRTQQNMKRRPKARP
jgi:hypothetical protein